MSNKNRGRSQKKHYSRHAGAKKMQNKKTLKKYDTSKKKNKKGEKQ